MKNGGLQDRAAGPPFGIQVLRSLLGWAVASGAAAGLLFYFLSAQRGSPTPMLFGLLAFASAFLVAVLTNWGMQQSARARAAKLDVIYAAQQERAQHGIPAAPPYLWPQGRSTVTLESIEPPLALWSDAVLRRRLGSLPANFALGAAFGAAGALPLASYLLAAALEKQQDQPLLAAAIILLAYAGICAGLNTLRVARHGSAVRPYFYYQRNLSLRLIDGEVIPANEYAGAANRA